MNSQPTPPTSDPAALQAEIDRLRARLDAAGLSADTAAAPPGRRRQRWRAVLSATLISLAVLLAPFSGLAVWASQEINNPDVYNARMAAVIDDQSVRDAISRRATSAVLDRVDLDALAGEAAQTIAQNRDLTQRQALALGFLADSAANAATNLVSGEIQDLVNSDQFEQIWLAANSAAHESLVAWLSGDDQRAVQVQGDALVVDVSEVLTRVKQRLTDRGIGLAERIPTDTDATFVLVESGAIGDVQTAYSALSTAGVWLPIVVVALALAGILVARSRRAALMGAGIGLLVAASVALIVLAAVSSTYTRALPDGVDTAAATAVFEALVAPLVGLYWAGFAIAVVLIIGAGLLGGGRFATDARRRAAAVGERGRGVLRSWGADLTGLRSRAVPAAAGLRIAAVAVAVVVLMLIPLKTVSAVAWILLGLVIALAVVELIAGGDPDSDEVPAQPTLTDTAPIGAAAATQDEAKP